VNGVLGDVYSDGSVRGERGKMLKSLPTAHKITVANRPAYAEARANKVQQAIQSALMQAGNVDKIPGAGPAEVIGAAAGVMWRQAFVDGKDGSGQPVYMRDKLAVWREVGQRAGLLEAERSEPPQSVTNVLVVDSDRAQRIARMLAQADAVDAEVAE
jgi:hypothetical protein